MINRFPYPRDNMRKQELWDLLQSYAAGLSRYAHDIRMIDDSLCTRAYLMNKCRTVARYMDAMGAGRYIESKEKDDDQQTEIIS